MGFYIRCPHCGHEHDGVDYIEDSDTDIIFTMKCKKCGKEFQVNYTSTFDFEINK